MKIKSFLLSALAMSIALVSCVKAEPQEEAASMTLEPETLLFKASGELSQTVSVKSNRDWKVSASDVPEWITLSVNGEDIAGKVIKASAEPATVTVTVLENTGMERTPAYIKFNGGTLASKTLTVRQEGGSSFQYTPISEVRAMLTGTSEVKLEDGLTIKGYVINNPDLDNLTSAKAMILQDETAGIYFYFNDSNSFAFGDELVVDLSGATLSLYNGLSEISKLPTTAAVKLSSGNVVEPKMVSVADFLQNKYESQYISIAEDVQVMDGSLGKTWVETVYKDGKDQAQNTEIGIVTRDGKAFVVFSSKYSSYGSESVAQGSGTIKGIGSINNDGMQLIFAQKTDWAGLTGERFETETLVTSKISEVVDLPVGSAVTLDNAIVVATSNTDLSNPAPSFLVTDADGDYLFVYHAAVEVKVGDKLTVKGNRSSYGTPPTPQIADPVVTIVSRDNSVSYPEAVDITDDFDNFSSDAFKYVTLRGYYYIKNNQYHEIVVYGADRVAAFLNPDVLAIEPYLDKRNVEFTGFYLYTNSTYPYFMLTSVKDSGKDYLEVDAKEQKFPASATVATIKVFANTAWTCESATAGFTVDKSSGTGDGTITVSFPANTITDDVVGEIKISDKNVTRTVKIIQGAASSGNEIVITAVFDNAGVYGLPSDSKNKLKGEQTFTVDGYEFILAGDGTNGCCTYKDGYMLFGKKGAYVQAPAIEGHKLKEITILTGKGASKSVMVGIFDTEGNVVTAPIKLEAQNAEFTLSISSPAENTAYRLQVDSDHNAQAQTLTFVYL